MRAIWKGAVLAQSNDTKVIENNHYFPPGSIDLKYFKTSNTHTHCPWKGEASYYTIEVNGQTNKDAAWYYPETSHAAKPIEGYVAFWKGVEISE
ncbi:DUF427 domain-containing protein [Marinirhabdus gelatinilytica]|uniref:Nucleotidyltransferase-like protein n=1 Tax=Marinirhabdus gelatinilytica TaxID=1703343 RepID=A0A370Q668_9FLAO|nr:DUF427 domain-containing protein [Marinirhabdus gelatinilytica]RDK83851.1 nucleotidyltransferase-like protein [Marinirhabdus gelatinilytica]